MAYTPHKFIKPQMIADGFAEALDLTVEAAGLVNLNPDFGKFDGVEGGKISIRVPGTLPVRSYKLGNDRRQSIVTDSYEETLVDMTVEKDRLYTAVEITDEEKDFNEGAWTKVIDRQSTSLAQVLDRRVIDRVLEMPTEIHRLVDVDQANVESLMKIGQSPLFNAFYDAVMDMRKMRIHNRAKFVSLVGYELAAHIEKDARLVKDQGLGASALTNATVGTLAGVQIVISPWVPSDQAIVFSTDAVNIWTAAPSVPLSTKFAAVTKAGNWATRWLMDYDSGFMRDRSVFTSYVGSSYTEDRLTYQLPTGQHVTHDEQYFVRGVRIGIKGGSLGSVSKLPGDGSMDTPGGNPDSLLAMIYKNTSGMLGEDEIARLGRKSTPAPNSWPLGGNYKFPAVAEATVTGGAVKSVVVNAPGVGYASAPTVTIEGAGSGATAEAIMYPSGGSIESIKVTNGGSGYKAESTVVKVSEPA